MNRRRFSASLGVLSIMGAPTVVLGGSSSDKEALQVRSFSSERLHQSLNLLQAAYEAKVLQVSQSLLPPLTEGELRERCAWFPAQLPTELVSLYSWHNGQGHGASDEKYPFWFRDCSFISVDQARAEYKSIMQSYGRPEYRVPEIDLRTCFPFAAFNGGWYVFPCKGQRYDSRLNSPIISVFQGVGIHYYSIEQMVETCVDWVRQPSYGGEKNTPDEKESMAIWKKHNPGIFPSAK